MTIEVINGPNLNMLGIREPEIYGSMTLLDIYGELRLRTADLGITLQFHQTSSEGEIIDLLHEAGRSRGMIGVVINPGGYTHSSVSIRDAISSITLPVVEVHLSNLHAREPFRQQSMIAPVCRGRIEGLGWRGYELAIRYLLDIAHSSKSTA
jgi:3-dehydroquinate dehydratase-2